MKIVVRGTNWIGDAVMTIPALRALRTLFPAAQISLLTKNWAQAIFDDADFIDELLYLPAGNNRASDLLGEVKLLRSPGFDLAVLFTNSFQTALAARLSGTKRRFGYKNEGRGFLLTDPYEKPKSLSGKHEVFHYLELIGKVENEYMGTKSVSLSKPNMMIEVSDEKRAVARRLLAKYGLAGSHRMIVLGVGSANSRAKRWLPESYAKLNNLLESKLGARVILMGSDDEIEISNYVANHSKHAPLVLTGKTSLAEAIAILAEADMLVSNDMGLAHISAAVGTKTLTIFGPTNPKMTKPWNSEIIVRTDVDCAPCLLRDCPIDHRCMTRITPSEVFEKVYDLLETP